MTWTALVSLWQTLSTSQRSLNWFFEIIVSSNRTTFLLLSWSARRLIFERVWTFFTSFTTSFSKRLTKKLSRRSPCLFLACNNSTIYLSAWHTWYRSPNCSIWNPLFLYFWSSLIIFLSLISSTTFVDLILLRWSWAVTRSSCFRRRFIACSYRRLKTYLLQGSSP